MKKRKVIVVGGGFAGIQLVRRLDDKLFDILLIDKINHHQFQPLFYQVATSQIEPSSISFPLRHIFRNKDNVQIRMAEVIGVDDSNKIISTTIGTFEYDYLVLAIGCKTNFFGNENLSKQVLSLKSTYDAITIRNHILLNFENILSAREEEKEGLFNIVIVGGGPTGVELAGAFSEIKKNILPRDFHRIDFSKLNIILIEGSKNTLNSMSDTARRTSRDYLRKMGVDIQLEKIVKNYNGEILELTNGEFIKTKSVIWAAGVIANEISGIPLDSITPDKRIRVDRINRVSGMEDVFAIGDIARMETPKYPKAHPQLANVAINQAKNLARNLKNLQRNKNLIEYEYKDLGTMATIGRNKAIVDFPFLRIKGFFGWLIWMFLHLMLILSVKNKLLIFINWAWAYITKNTSLRLILKDNKNKS
ncbi:MAG TPA: NAD(P)/FAD-dependent oxidoreductase [Lentimicrobium sp.]|jgi:NADH dehydrogenase|nr:NAD(P)/FAD-dependent oxidoreductase [Lentimicrobium sp.]